MSLRFYNYIFLDFYICIFYLFIIYLLYSRLDRGRGEWFVLSVCGRELRSFISWHAWAGHRQADAPWNELFTGWRTRQTRTMWTYRGWGSPFSGNKMIISLSWPFSGEGCYWDWLLTVDIKQARWECVCGQVNTWTLGDKNRRWSTVVSISYVWNVFLWMFGIYQLSLFLLE